MHQDWIELAREKFCDMYREYCDRLTTTPTFERNISTVQSPRITALTSWKFEANVPSTNTDELEEYLQSSVENGSVSPREWWRFNQARFPVLASMAWNILSIPAMSAEVERVFSGYGLNV